MIYKKLKSFVLVLLFLFIISYAVTPIFAYSTRTDEELIALYNETNTYNVKVDNLAPDMNYLDINGSLYETIPSNKNSNVVSSEAPLVTFITHGLSGDASHWSNLNNYRSYERFGLNISTPNESLKNSLSFTEDSILAVLSGMVDANVYYAGFNAYHEYYLVNLTEQNIDVTTMLGRQYDVDYSTTRHNNRILDISKHSIVLFDSSKASSPNNEVYEQFNYMASKVVYDIKKLNGNVLPKVNLIGHSRGGLTNLQYALDHPDLVDSMFSFGTPYLGTESLNFAETIGLDFVTEDKYQDLLTYDESSTETEIWKHYLNRWNNNYDVLYSHIRAHALGGYSSFSSFLDLLLLNDYLINELISALPTEFQQISPDALKVALYVIKELVMSKIAKYLPIADLIIDVIYQINAHTGIFDELDMIEGIIDFLSTQFRTSINGLDFMNDGLVDLESQLGDKGSMVYRGFNRFTKEFSLLNSDINKISANDFTVVHNLQTRDNDFISYVARNIRMKGAFNNEFITHETSNGDLYIGNYIGQSSDVVVPSYLGPNKVIGILEGAFSYTDIETIVLPSTIEELQGSVFTNNQNLTSIDLSSTQVNELGNQAIYRNEQLTTLVLPNNLQEIGKQSIANNPNLAGLSIPNSVTEIGDEAFINNESLQQIQLPSALYSIDGNVFLGSSSLIAIQIDGSNGYFSTLDGVLYDKQKDSLIVYPEGKQTVNFTVPASVDYVGKHSFANNTYIQTLNLNQTKVIYEEAFLNATSLSNISAPALESVKQNALYQTTWLDQQGDIAVLGDVLVKYKGSLEIFDGSLIPQTVRTVGSGAFSNTNIMTLYIPSFVEVIEDQAFTNMQHIEDIYVLGSPFIDANVFGDTINENTRLLVPLSLETALINNSYYDQTFKAHISPIKTTLSLYSGDTYTSLDVYYGESYELPESEIPLMTNYWYDEFANYYATTGIWTNTRDNITMIAEKADNTLFVKGSTVLYDIDLNQGDIISIISNGLYINGVFHTELPASAPYYENSFMVNGQYLDSFTYNGTDTTITITEQAIIYTLKIYNYNPYNGMGTYVDIPFSYTDLLYNGLDYFTPGNYTEYTFDDLYTSSSFSPYLKLNSVDQLMQMSNKTVYAKWFVVYYTLTLDFKDGTNPSYISVSALNNIVILPSRTRPYYDSGYWTKNEGGHYPFNASYSVYASQVLFIEWDPTDYYIYYLNTEGASNSLNVTTYNIESSTFNLLNIYRSDYNFLGWYSDSNFGTRVTKIYTGTVGNKTLYAKWQLDVDYTRTTQYTITDSGRFNQNYDIIDLDSVASMSVSALKAKGYSTITLTFSIEIWEKDDGYQHIYIYDGYGSSYTMFYQKDIEHVAGSKSSTHITYTFSYTMNLDDFDDGNRLYILYGAHGNFADTWYNTNLTVRLTANQTYAPSTGGGGSGGGGGSTPVFEIMY